MTYRKREIGMNWDELREALYTHEFSGVPNKRAFDDSVKLPTQVHIDMLSLTAHLEVFVRDARDQMLTRLAETLREEDSENIYHVSGARFKAQTENRAHADALMRRVNARLVNATLNLRAANGRRMVFRGLGFSYGIGINEDDAEQALTHPSRSLPHLRHVHGGPDCIPDVVKMIAARAQVLSLIVPP